MTAPRCRDHVSVEMVPVGMRGGRYRGDDVDVPLYSDETFEGIQKASRKVFRCSVAGCHFVSQVSGEEVTAGVRPRCSNCGQEVDHDRHINMRQCNKCLRAKYKLRQKRLRRDKPGLSRSEVSAAGWATRRREGRDRSGAQSRRKLAAN